MEPRRRVTRSIPQVTAVAVIAGAGGRGVAPCVAHGRGRTLLDLDDEPG